MDLDNTEYLNMDFFDNTGYHDSDSQLYGNKLFEEEEKVTSVTLAL